MESLSSLPLYSHKSPLGSSYSHVIPAQRFRVKWVSGSPGRLRTPYVAELQRLLTSLLKCQDVMCVQPRSACAEPWVEQMALWMLVFVSFWQVPLPLLLPLRLLTPSFLDIRIWFLWTFSLG
ncbi:mCG8473 [Mus musculus]|nr:mCG8473 [Mus musculus]